MPASLTRRFRGGEGITLAALALVVTGFCGVPLLMLFRVGVAPEGSAALGPLLDVFASRSVMGALWRSVESGLLSALVATLVGTALALAIGLTNVRCKGPLVFLILLPMMIPPHVTAIAWIQALGPASPVLRWVGLAPEIGSTHPIYSRQGLVALLAIQHMPLVFLVVRASLRTFPRELSDAARICGAGAVRLLARITLPLLAPSLVAGFSLAFVAALGNFGINALIGIPARYTTLPVLIWRRLSSYGPDVLGNVAVISVLLALVALVAGGLQLLVQRRLRTALVGPPQAPLAIDLGRWRPLVEAGLWAVVAATLVLPSVSLIATALVKTYGLPLSADTLTLANFEEVLVRQEVTLRAFANSTSIAAIAACVIAVVAIGLGYFLSLRRGGARRVAGVLASQANVAFAVPGLVVSIAFILAFIRPVPGLGVSLYGTLWIILMAYLAAFLAIGLNPVAAASGAILVFLTAYNEVTVSALLWSAGHETIGTVIFNYEDGGYTTLAAAMAAVTVVATILIMTAMNALARLAPPGTIPWRD